MFSIFKKLGNLISLRRGDSFSKKTVQKNVGGHAQSGDGGNVIVDYGDGSVDSAGSKKY